MRWSIALWISAACAPPSAPYDACADETACVELRIVAHQDDDLLFMNPDIAAAIARGHRTTMLYLTAGTAGDPARAEERERGALDAYTYMIAPDQAAVDRADGDRVVATWQRTVLARGVRYERDDLSLVFLRLLEHNDGADLDKLWRGEAPAIGSLDGWSITRDELIALLAAFIDAANASSIATLDATQLFHDQLGYGEHRVDHPDHVAAASFALAAFVRSQAARFDQYRAYTITDEVPNLADDDALAKRRIFYRYFALGEPLVDDDGELTNRDPDDPHFRLDQYDHWCARRYAIRSADDRHGRLAIADRCLALDGLVECARAPAWQIASHELRTDSGACLVLAGDTACTRVAATAIGQLRTADAGCLTSTADGVRAAPCVKFDGGPAILQRWRWR